MTTTQGEAELALVERARVLPAGGLGNMTPTPLSRGAAPAGCGTSAGTNTWTSCSDPGRCWSATRIRR